MRPSPLSLIVSAAALLPPLQTAPRSGAALEQRLAARVSEQRAVEHVRELVALGPRMGGTASGRRAAEWRVRTFDALGLRVETVDGEESWVHEELDWSVRAHVAGEETRSLARAWPWGFSPPGRGRAALGLEVSEAGALLREARPRRSQVGAAAVVLVDGVTTPDGNHPALRHLPRGDTNPAPVFGVSRAEGALLRSALAAGKRVEIEYDLSARISRARPRTVVATLPARAGAPAGFVLFCAHGDSDAGGPGANDNASGEAIVIEIATAWSAAVAAGEVSAPPCDVRFAIWGSEITSTRHYLSSVEQSGAAVLAVVNFDQSGFGSGADVLFLEPDDLPANRSLLSEMLAVLAEHRGRPGFPERWATTRSQGGTDSYVFSRHDSFRAQGRPALTLYASAWDRARELPRTAGMPGESWNDGDVVHVDHDVHYHSAGDRPENTTDLEPWNMGWSARVAWLGTLRWLERQPGR